MSTRNGKYLILSLETTTQIGALPHLESMGDWAWSKVKARILHQNGNDPISSGKTEWLNEWFQFGFSAFSFIAPNMLCTKEVLEYQNFLEYLAFLEYQSFLLFKSLQWLSPDKKLGYFHFTVLTKKSLWYKPRHNIYFKKKVSLFLWYSANKILLEQDKKSVQWSKKLTALWTVLTSTPPAYPRRCPAVGLCCLWICSQGT